MHARTRVEKQIARLRMAALPLLCALFLVVTSTSCLRSSPIARLPTPIPITRPTAVATDTPTSAPTATPAPSPTSAATPTRPPATPTAEARAPIEPQTAASLQEVARATSGIPLKLIWSLSSGSVAAQSQSGVSIYDANNLLKVKDVTMPASTRIIDFSPDGHTIATAKDQTQVDFTDVNTAQITRSLRPGQQFTGGVFSPDGRTFALFSGDEIAVTLWDVATGQQVKKLTGFKTAAPVYSATFGPGGKTLIWKARAEVQTQDVSTGQFGPILSHEDFVTADALAPGGKILATAVPGRSGNQTVGLLKLWDAVSGKEMMSASQADGAARSMSFSPDGRILATANGNKIELWDVARQGKLATLTGSTAPVDAVAFSPDGASLASGSDDGTLRLWRVGSLK